MISLGEDGERVGSALGEPEGDSGILESSSGKLLGCLVFIVGSDVGRCDGLDVGYWEGWQVVGDKDGSNDGILEGSDEGYLVGQNVGYWEGSTVEGKEDGSNEGMSVGTETGNLVGYPDGNSEGW